MKTFEKKGLYRVQIPDGWEVDEDEEPLAIYHPDGAGAVHFIPQPPIPLKKGELIDAYLMLRAFLNQTSAMDIEKTAARRYSERGLDWAFSEFEEELPDEGPVWSRAWIATNQKRVVYVVYGSRIEEQDRERDVIDSIVESLEII